MPRLVTASVVKDEASRFLESALTAWQSFSDEVIVVDDHSEDETAELCLDAGVRLYDNLANDGMWGDEAPVRRYLFELAWGCTRPGDAILILDADMVPAQSPRPLLRTSPDAVAFQLYDLWTAEPPLLYRHDEFWQGHLYPRTWLVRRIDVPADALAWNDRGIHCGHVPMNLPNKRTLFAPYDFSLLHMAYSTPGLRKTKHEAYMSQQHQLTASELAHADSILDDEPNLRRLPFEPALTLQLRDDPNASTNPHSVSHERESVRPEASPTIRSKP